MPERELAAIVGYLPDIISRFDLQKRHLFISPAIEAVTGMPPQAFIGKTNEELGMDPLLCARFGAVIDDVARNGIVREMEFSFVGPLGDEHYFVTRAVPAFGADGKVESVMTIAADHTLRELAARQLRNSENLLQQADARKNEYLATLAHELRGPLAPIATAVQLMKMADFDQRHDVWLRSRQVIERQVGQLVELVDDLMEVGRISSGKLVLRLARVSLQSAIEHALESVRPLFDAGGQTLTVDLPAQPVWLDADSTRLTQVFTNLLTNASKYTPAGGQVALSVAVSSGSVAIVVKDDGIGLTDQAMTTIFDMFSQVHPQGQHAKGGLGIGLSLVRHLVRLHEGEIMVKSGGPGQGAEFTVHLPLPVGAAQSPQVQEARQPRAVSVVPKKVLVVDDNVDGAETLVALLETMGHQARSVHNGNDAIAAAGDGGYDLLLLDLGLPDISGVQVALHLRGTAWGRHLKLVALTGLSQQHDRDMTRLAGFDLHLVKPVRIDDLVSLVGSAAAA
jgi:PAS domain S-box-containing protein